MIILSIKTDQPMAEIGLFDSEKEIGYVKWHGHKELSATIHKKIAGLLEPLNLPWDKIEGVIIYEGPGSFTGLRIGASVANALAASLDIPIAQASGDDWIKEAMKKLQKNPDDRVAMPNYGGVVHITKPRK